MRFENDWVRKLTGLGVVATVRQWMGTLDIAGYAIDPAADPAHEDFQGPAIFVLWHEYIPVPFYLRPRGRTALLISRHADAEWLSQAARYVGLETVRGSTGRGGATVLLEMLAGDRQCNLAVTPDGPRGPRRKMSMGAVFLASQTRWPIVLFGSGYDRPWRLPTWDRFAIPRPYSRCRVVMSPPLHVPSELDRTGLESHRWQLEQQMLRLTETAERWAESGARWPGQLPGTVQKGVPPSMRANHAGRDLGDEGDGSADVRKTMRGGGRWRRSA